LCDDEGFFEATAEDGVAPPKHDLFDRMSYGIAATRTRLWTFEDFKNHAYCPAQTSRLGPRILPLEKCSALGSSGLYLFLVLVGTLSGFEWKRSEKNENDRKRWNLNAGHLLLAEEHQLARAVVMKNEFAYLCIEDPTAPGAIWINSYGSGVYMMKAFMDEVRFEQGGTVVHMRKKSGNTQLTGWGTCDEGRHGNNNRLRTERTLSRNCSCSIGRKDDGTGT
jgi:hypothetical protein